MSGDLTPATGGIDAVSSHVVYGVVVGGMAEFGNRLAALAEQVRATYRYVEGCADGVDRLADQMQGLTVDTDTVSEHRDAAAAMRAALIAADQMALGMEELAGSFSAAADAHMSEYGTVADTASSMTVPMADADFYGNR